MEYKELKTVTLLLRPTESGWLAVHKKFKNPYGVLDCAMCGDKIEVTTHFGDFVEERKEAVEAAAYELFTNTKAAKLVIDGEDCPRVKWQEEQNALFAALHKTAEDYKNVLGKRVHCVVDRPLGKAHPRYPDMIYPVNYGYVPGIMAGDGAEQDVYILGPDEPVETFDGVVICVVHRFDDCEDKWVVAEKTGVYSESEIRAALEFQEKYYKSEWIMACTRN